MNEEANVALILYVYDAFRRGDIETVLKHLARISHT